MKVIAAGILLLFAAFALSLLMALPTMWLWNWLVPSIFGLREVGLLEAFGLNLLSSMFFSHTTSSSK